MTARDVTLREAPLAYAPLLSALHAQSYVEPWDEEALARLLASPGVAALIAVARTSAGEAPLGFILVRQAADEAEILTLCVVPRERGIGIGARLLEAALDRAHARGAKTVFLEVGLTNPPALRLYARAGFVEIGRRRGYYRNPAGLNEDAITLRRVL